ncbi:hypothetical protein M2103_001941 [Ereboglobus sp. PH5-5]|uniref:type II secretion system protein GspG n=1 Tax=Ereboglobus sp. PH5-5 TaxID=2940529 RepID=UPI0024071906|nr:type II secretion system protein GspG [Ereboglobus sp. PH5-5]MDF9833708.1 hypothetical protein [Ereboglobus sp. PH5-5]
MKLIKLTIITLFFVFIIISIIMIFFLLQRHEPAKTEFTRGVVNQWAQYIKLYHGIKKLPAPDLNTVLDTVSNEAVKDPNVAKNYDEKIYIENKKRLSFDSWGNKIIFRYETRANNELWVVVTSKGPDGTLGTNDDITAERQVRRPEMGSGLNGT